MGASGIGKKNTVATTKSAKKNIACLETLWYDDAEQPITVAPLLGVIEKRHRVNAIHFTCNTKEELKFCLGKLPKRSPYRILYLALHGDVGAVALADESLVSLDDLSVFMGSKFKNWIVYFGSCYTLAAEKRELQQFLRSTKTALLIGYDRNIDWVESAALDLIILDWLERYTNLGAFLNRVHKDYRGLIRLTGLKIVRPAKE